VVFADSRRLSRIRRYSGVERSLQPFAYGPITLCGAAFLTASARQQVCNSVEDLVLFPLDPTIRLGNGDDEGIDGRSPLRGGAQDAGSASEVLGDLIEEVADLQEPARDGVVLRAAAEALGQDHGRHHRRPDALAEEDGDQRSGVLAPSGQTRYASGVQDQAVHDAWLASPDRPTWSATASALAIAAPSGVPTSATSSSR
jgi:hypothetical protein